MNILTIPDVHGSHCWERAKGIINRYDKVIILGDYFDSWVNIWPDQMDNFKNIINFKKENIDKVELCIGNHDLSYLSNQHCSGYQYKYAAEIKEELQKTLPLMQVIVVHGNILFSHAGLSQEWMNDQHITKPEEVDAILQDNPMRLDWVGPNGFGDNPNEGPLWIRPSSLIQWGIPGFRQVVGHTEMRGEKIGLFVEREDRKYHFIDTQDHSLFFEIKC